MHKQSESLNLQFIINKTRDYMFTKKNMDVYLSGPWHPRDISTTKAPTKNISSNTTQKNSGSAQMTGSSENKIYIPPEKDTLFWCLYIIKYGRNAYDILGQHTFKEEKREKIRLVELIRLNKAYVKAQKLRYKNIEEELVHHPRISLTTFLCLSALQKKSVAIIQKRRYYCNIEDEPVQYFIEDTCDGWGLYTMINETSQEKELYCQENYWYISHWSKPLKGISSYKIAALRDICKRLDLPTKHMLDNGKQKWINKTDLYLSIKQIV